MAQLKFTLHIQRKDGKALAQAQEIPDVFFETHNQITFAWLSEGVPATRPLHNSTIALHPNGVSISGFERESDTFHFQEWWLIPQSASVVDASAREDATPSAFTEPEEREEDQSDPIPLDLNAGTEEPEEPAFEPDGLEEQAEEPVDDEELETEKLGIAFEEDEASMEMEPESEALEEPVMEDSAEEAISVPEMQEPLSLETEDAPVEEVVDVEPSAPMEEDDDTLLGAEETADLEPMPIDDPDDQLVAEEPAAPPADEIVDNDDVEEPGLAEEVATVEEPAVDDEEAAAPAEPTAPMAEEIESAEADEPSPMDNLDDAGFGEEIESVPEDLVDDDLTLEGDDEIITEESTPFATPESVDREIAMEEEAAQPQPAMEMEAEPAPEPVEETTPESGVMEDDAPLEIGGADEAAPEDDIEPSSVAEAAARLQQVIAAGREAAHEEKAADEDKGSLEEALGNALDAAFGDEDLSAQLDSALEAEEEDPKQ